MPPLPALLALSHVAVRAADVDRSCAFYRDALGLAEHCRLNDLRTGKLMLVCFKVSDSQWIEVFAGRGPRDNVVHQVAFRVGDAEAVRTVLAGCGAPVPASTPTGQMGNRNFVVVDPDGQEVEFVEHLSTSLIERDRGRYLASGRISSRLMLACLAIGDPAAAAGFYAALGLTLPTAGEGAVDLSNGDRLEFVPRARFFPRFGLGVENLAAAREYLRRRGVAAVSAASGAGAGRVLEVHDPDGVCIRLSECPPFA